MVETTTGIQKGKLLEVGYQVYSRYYNLSNTHFLYMSHDKDKKTTILKVFLVSNPKTAQAEKIMEGEYQLLCIFNNGSMLLSKKDRVQPLLIKICPITLAVLSSQDWQHNTYFFNKTAAIGSDWFFLINYDSAITKKQANCEVIFYKWKEDSFVKSHVDTLSLTSKTSCTYISSVVHLGKNRYGCHLRGNNTPEFTITLFDINLDTKMIEEVGAIQPKMQHNGAGSPASGILEVLPNGYLLTYHPCHDNVQIWDTQTLQCIATWNWTDIPTPKKFSIWCLKISPILNSGNLIVYQNDQLYLFNVYCQAIKQIHLSAIPSYYGPLHVLANGEILTFVDPYTKENDNDVLHFDTKELVNYRKLMGNYYFSKERVFRFFNNQLPVELTTHILSYAFSKATFNSLSQRASKEAFDMREDSSLKNCVCM